MRASQSFVADLRESDISITDSARAELARIFSGCNDAQVQAIRLFVAGRGCSGMVYAMTFTDRRHEHDHVIECDGYRIFVDAIAYSYLEGSQIDFERRTMGDTFVFNGVFQATHGSGLCGGCGAAGG